MAYTADSGSQAAAYFGNNQTSADFESNSTVVLYNVAIAFTCPGTGTRTIDSLDVYAKSNGGTPGSITMGLGTNANPSTVLFYGTTPVSINNTTAQWWSQTSFTGTAQCTGGTIYKMFVSFAKSTDPRIGRISAGYTTGDYLYNESGDYTGGWPGTIATNGADGGYAYGMRAHVAAIP
jgi:hypothetical protein